jgi:hypothetical protein
MEKNELLINRRNLYLTITKLYFAELHKGAPIEALNNLKARIDTLILEINDLERDLGITNHPIQ